MKRIDNFVPSMQHFCIWGGGFTEEECDAIIAIAELREFKDAHIGASDNSRVDDEIRKTNVVWLEEDDDTHWFFERLNQIASKINFDKFQLQLDCFDSFQYSKYEVGCHYDWHTDIIENPDYGLYRKLSLSVMLSDPDDFEGGEFHISPSGNNASSVNVKASRGDVVAFYSHLPHKVCPVTKGERITLVTWCLGGKIK